MFSSHKTVKGSVAVARTFRNPERTAVAALAFDNRLSRHLRDNGTCVRGCVVSLMRGASVLNQ
jgi:hypothetical protein